METTLDTKLREKAARIKEIDDEVTQLNARLEEVKSEREGLSNELVAELQGNASLQDGEGIRLADIGFVKLECKNYPKILDIEGLQSWADTEGVDLPAMTINPNTFAAFWKEQVENGKPLPPDNLVSSFLKTRVKILK